MNKHEQALAFHGAGQAEDLSAEVGLALRILKLQQDVFWAK